MTDTHYAYTPHPRIEERKTEGPVHVIGVLRKRMNASSAIVKFNGKLGLGITTSVGTMWAAYAFFLLSLVSLPAAIASHSAIVIVSWIAQTFLQLVLLPVIIVGQNIQAAAADARSDATYKDAGAILDEAKQIQAHLASQDAAITTLLAKVLALEKALSEK